MCGNTSSIQMKAKPNTKEKKTKEKQLTPRKKTTTSKEKKRTLKTKEKVKTKERKIRDCYTFYYQPKDTTVVGNTTRSPNYLPRHIYSLHQHAATGDRRDLRTTTTRMILRLSYYSLASKEGHVRTTHKSETWKSATTTRLTTMQG